MVDEAIVDLMTWVEAKAAERTIGKAPEKQPRKGQAWVPKYAGIGDILAEYGQTDHDPHALPEGVTENDIAALRDELEASIEPEF